MARFSIGLLEAMSLLGWTLAVLACLISIDKQNRVLGAILMLSAAVGAALAPAPGGTATPKPRPGWELTAHILLSMGAAALLFAAAVTALLLVFLDRRLRMRRIVDLPSALPPLDALEKIMFRLIAAGFGLLTLALLTGFVFVTNLFTQNLVQKTVLSLIAWLMFGVLLIGRVALRLARPLGGALDLERFRHSGGRVFRREVRPRGFVRAALGLICRRHGTSVPRTLVRQRWRDC